MEHLVISLDLEQPIPQPLHRLLQGLQLLMLLEVLLQMHLVQIIQLQHSLTGPIQ